MPVLRKNGYLNRLDLAEIIEQSAYSVYAITDLEFIKIGKTIGHPHERMAELQTGNPRNLYLLAWTIGVTEQQMHKRLWKYHIRGEWFKICSEMIHEIRTWVWLDVHILTKVTSKIIPQIITDNPSS